MFLSSQGTFLQHTAAPKSLIKAWKSWSSGNAEERPAQPVGSRHLLRLSTERFLWHLQDGFNTAAASSSPEWSYTSTPVERIQPGPRHVRLALSRGGLDIFSCLPSRAFRQLKASLELPSAHHTACNCVCNARGSSALKPHSHRWMSPGICTFPTAATHPAPFP